MVANELWFGKVSEYEIDNSCIFNDNDSPYLSKTLGTATDANRWTYSTWLKRGNLGISYPVIVSAGSGSGDTDRGDIVMTTDNEFQFSGGSTVWRKTTKLFRDTAAWYHFIIAVNTDESGNDMIKIYLNGSQITDFATTNNPSGAANTGINTAIAHNIGRQTHGSDGWWDGYMSEINFIDGQQLTPASFGETNDEGVWIPTKFSGTYGDNGFFLEFGDSSALGDDTSGETNDWAISGLAASDQSTDTPSNNFCTVNPIYRGSNATASAYGVTTQGNLGLEFSGSADGGTLCTQLIPSGKFYWEIQVVAGGNNANYDLGGGIADANSSYTKGSERMRGIATGEIGLNSYNGEVRFSNTVTKTYSEVPLVDTDTIGVAVDADNGAIYYSKNGTFMGSGDPTSGATKTNAGATWTAASYPHWVPTGNVSGGSTPKQMFNFGQNGTFNGTITAGGNSDGNGVGDFKYSVPSGYLALCSNNLEAPTITDPSKHFQTALWTGNGSTQTITFGGNSDMQPDLIWAKCRSAGDAHVIQEVNTGVGTAHFLTRTDSDAVTDAVTAFNSDGFALGDGSELANGTINTSTRTYASWNWKANGSGSSNTTGSINTTKTSVDTTSGFGISTYTGNGSDQATYGHGLGVVPAAVWTFSLTSSDHRVSSTWVSGTAAISNQVGIDSVGDAFNASDGGSGKVEGGSSTVFTLGQDPAVNGSGVTYMSMYWAEVAGFSRFGQHTGNANADGNFAYCGFSPELLIFKTNAGDEKWVMFDRARDTYNPALNYISPTNDDAEATGSGFKVDFLSNGFKLRAVDGNYNKSGVVTIWMAFAKRPFGGDGVAPTTAI